MTTLDRAGARIAYTATVGPPHRLPLLLSHGYGASQAMWAPNVAALAADRTVVTWDIRGHGDSSSPVPADAYSADESVADMAAVLDAVGAERAVLAGMSLGGYLSLAFRYAHPERVAALLLVDTGPGYRNDAAREEWNARARRTAERLERDGAAALPSGAEAVGGRQDPAGLARAARGILAQRDGHVIETLPAVDVPTLVVVGADDKPFLGAAEYMARKIPGAREVVIPNAGHASNVDQPAAFNAAAGAFLAGLAV